MLLLRCTIVAGLKLLAGLALVREGSKRVVSLCKQLQGLVISDQSVNA